MSSISRALARSQTSSTCNLILAHEFAHNLLRQNDCTLAIYHAMATLVTGGTGFVGINVVEALLEGGEDVVVFDAGNLPPDAARAFERYGSRLSIERGSVLQPQAVRALFGKHPTTNVFPPPPI